MKRSPSVIEWRVIALSPVSVSGVFTAPCVTVFRRICVSTQGGPLVIVKRRNRNIHYDCVTVKSVCDTGEQTWQRRCWQPRSLPMQQTGSDDSRVVPIARRVCSGLEWCLTQNNGPNVAVKTLLIDVGPCSISTSIMSVPVPSVKTVEETNEQGCKVVVQGIWRNLNTRSVDQKGVRPI